MLAIERKHFEMMEILLQFSKLDINLQNTAVILHRQCLILPDE